jgi:hypothetical protein
VGNATAALLLLLLLLLPRLLTSHCWALTAFDLSPVSTTAVLGVALLVSGTLVTTSLV